MPGVKAKKIRFLCIVIAFLFFTTACTAETLPVPDFPLSEATVVGALEESGLPWQAEPRIIGITRDGTYFSDFTFYKNTATIGFFTSGVVDGERVITFTFLGYFGDSPTIDAYNPPKEYWETIIAFMTRLYGGFASPCQVFHYFDKELDILRRYPVEHPPWVISDPPGNTIEELATWERVINGVQFGITIVRPIGSPNEYLRLIHAQKE